MKSPGGDIHLSGIKEPSGAYSGIVTDINHDKLGSWYVSQIAETAAAKSDGEMDALRAYLALDAQLKSALNASAKEEIIVNQQKSELDRLRTYVDEGEALRNNADQTFKEKRQALHGVFW